MINFQLIRSVLLFAATNALAAGLPLLLLPLLTRVLSPEDYGLVAMYSVLLTTMGALTGLSVHGAVAMRYFDRDTIQFPQFVGACFSILGVTTAAVFLLTWAAHRPLESLTSLPLKWLLLGVITSGLQFILLMRLSICQSAKSAGLFGMFRVGQALVDAISSLAFVLVLSWGWQGRLTGMSAGIAVLGICSLVSLLRGGWIEFSIRGDYIRNALKFGVPLIPHVVGGMMIAMVDRVIITNFLDISKTGIYMVAVQIGLGVSLLADACGRAISPWWIETIKAADSRKSVLIVRLCYFYFLFLILVAVAIGLSAPWFLSFLVGKAFQDAGPLVLLIAIGQALGGMYLVVANVIFYKNKTAHLAAITISCGVLNAVLAYFLLQEQGLQGVAQAYVLSQLSLFIATLILSQSLYPLPWISAFRRSPKESASA